MKQTFNNIAFAGLILLASVTGCHNNDGHADIRGEAFVPADQPTSVGRIVEAQAAAGAKSDGMLYDAAFNGNELNSQGQVKLDLIRKGTHTGDAVVVYLNMPHDLIALREPAVSQYLKTAGLADTQIAMIEGANPNQTTPTAYNMSGLYKGETSSMTGQAAADTGGAGGGMGVTGK